MIWKLEVSCGEANDAQMAITAAAATERGQIISYQDKCAAMAGTDALPKEKALELLKEVSGRPAILEAVYVYWCEKRKRTGSLVCVGFSRPPRQTTPTLSMSSASARRRTVRRRGAVARTTRRRSKRCARSDATWRWRTPSWSCSCVAKRRSWSARGASATRRRCRSSFDTSPGRCTRRSRRSTRRSRRRALSPKELEWDPSRTVTLPMSQVEVEMRPDGTYGLGGERFAPPPGPGAAPGSKHGSKKRRREEQMAMHMAAKGYGDPRDRSMSMGLGGMGGFGPGPGLAGLLRSDSTDFRASRRCRWSRRRRTSRRRRFPTSR